jgi:SAM-dependent methyltransferase
MTARTRTSTCRCCASCCPRRAGGRSTSAAGPFPEETFDLVVAYMCRHDIDDLAGATAEIGRVLTRGGRLCAAIVHPLNSAGRFQGRGPDAPFVIAGWRRPAC